MLLVCEARLREHIDVVLEVGARRGIMDERAHLRAIERKSEARERGGVGDGVGKDVEDVHSGARELGCDHPGLRIARRVRGVVPGAMEHVRSIEMYEATRTARTLRPRTGGGVYGHLTGDTVPILVVNGTVG